MDQIALILLILFSWILALICELESTCMPSNISSHVRNLGDIMVFCKQPQLLFTLLGPSQQHIILCTVRHGSVLSILPSGGSSWYKHNLQQDRLFYIQ